MAVVVGLTESEASALRGAASLSAGMYRNHLEVHPEDALVADELRVLNEARARLAEALEREENMARAAWGDR